MLDHSTPDGYRNPGTDPEFLPLPDEYSGKVTVSPAVVVFARISQDPAPHGGTDSPVVTNGTAAPGVEPAWYCLRSQPKHEHIAAAHVRRLEGVNVFCPRIRFKKQTRQGLVWVTEAMFPSYLFARFNLMEMHRQVRYAPGIKVILRFGEVYPTVDEPTMMQLREYTGDTDIKVISGEVSRGDGVTVADGVFAGLEAVVTQVLPAGRRVKILMDFLGRRMEAEINVASIVAQTVNLASR